MLARLVRYALVSIASSLIDYLLFVLLSYVAGVPYPTANVAARVESAVANFTAHKVISFRSPRRTLPKAARYVLALAFALSMASVLLYVAVEYLTIGSLIASRSESHLRNIHLPRRPHPRMNNVLHKAYPGQTGFPFAKVRPAMIQCAAGRTRKYAINCLPRTGSTR